ncbi:MAG: hypothetical protein KAT15_05630 [Bacteroidales bacterium]|nr:hypothetical protein [Bacteroidales bacterium]
MAKHYRKPDIAISMNGTTWARLYLNTSSLNDEIKADKVKITKGEKAEAKQILDMFDKFEPAQNVFIPALHD